jgi:hypothetical protein
MTKIMPSIRARYLCDNPIPISGPLTIYDIGAFLLKHKMNPSRFGRDAVGDPAFLSDVRQGRQVRPATWDRVHKYIAAMEAQHG